MKLFIMLLLFISGFAQTNNDCLKNSLINFNYYLNGSIIKKGYAHGELNLSLKIDYEKSNTEFIALTVNSEELNTNTPVLLGANCVKVSRCNDEFDSFKIKKLLDTSDKNGTILLNRNLKGVDYICINYPGFIPLIYKYKQIMECGEMKF